MKVLTPAGDELRISRRWFPWRKRITGQHVSDAADSGPTGDGAWLDGGGFGDDPISAAIAVFFFAIVLIFLLPVLIVGLFFALEFLLLLLLVPIFIPVRSVLAPWTIEVERGKEVLHEEQVKGWFPARRRMNELAMDYRNGVRR